MDRVTALTRDRPPTGISHDDDDVAIGTIGTIASDDAVGFDPLPLLRALAHQGAPAVVIGQVAGIMHGSVELTGDLDLLWSGRPTDSGRMAAAFTEVRAELFDDRHAPVEDPARAFALPKVLFRTSSASGDCCTPTLPWGGLDMRAILARAEWTHVEGVPVRYLAFGDLMAMRRLSGRPKDRRRLTELERLAATHTPLIE